MMRQLLVLNCGSSSIKFALYTATDEPQRLLHGTIAGLGTAPRFSARDSEGKSLPESATSHAADRSLTQESAPHWLFDWLEASGYGRDIVAAGHRVVHGGERFLAPARIDDGVLDALEHLDPMAPLHQPHNLAAVRTLKSLRPELPQVACFDTAFHGTQPAVAQRYALPRELTAQGIRRYGFHGLSYEYIADILPAHLGARADGRVVVAHLGNGASMCALNHRRSIATTMGFTALDGLVMGTRSGAIDPGVIFYLMREKAMSADDVEALLYHRSGLLGVSGLSSDMRELIESGEARAQEAVELFVYRAARELGSLAAALGGLDALVFTAGIGEHAAPVRAMICEQARWLGIAIDAAANARHDSIISAPQSGVAVCVVPTNEELVIARHTRRLLNA
ncbi:MAG TPA: acetate/propionate family kinase [Burkholderiales bacterium]|nr:acetate/propionate family kinase [Burkholderiales bacterium]